MNDEKYLALRIDKVREFLANQDRNLSEWAINYWTVVLAQLERKWTLCNIDHAYPTTVEIIEQHKLYLKNIRTPREKTYD
jgi:hypothetical protein